MSNVNKIGATVADVANESKRAAARLVLLVTELKTEMNHRRGWQSEIAKRTGVDQGMLSKIMSLERDSIGLRYVESMRNAYNLRWEYFHGAREPESYHDYILSDMDAPYDAWMEFAATELGKSMTSPERRTLASTRFESGDPTVAVYQSFLLAIRGLIKPSTRAQASDDNARLQRENAEDDEPEKPRPKRR